MNNKYKVITLCNSIKFKDKFLQIQEKLTLDKNIVLAPNFFTNITEEISAEILVININGYIGESTKSEIKYAKENEKIIKYLES